MQIKLIAVNCRFTHSNPALFYLRQQLARHLAGHRIELRQFALNDPYYQVLLRIAEGRPEAVFFSVYVWNRLFIRRLAEDLLAILPEVRLVLGGPEAGQLCGPAGPPPRWTIVRGEVEGLAASFYEDLEKGSLLPAYQAAPGPVFSLPYEKEDFAGELKNRQIYYESSRGCPFSCTYCLSSLERGVRHRDLAEVKEELRFLLRQRPQTIRFVDRTFNASPSRALRIWQFLAEQEPGTVFHFEIAPDLFTEEMFAFLETLAPGRFQFEMGIQSTNPETLAAVRRQVALAPALATIARLSAMDNIHLHVDLILGLPFETGKTFRGSINQVFRAFPHHIQMGLLKVLPGTGIDRAREEYGLVACAQPPYEVLATRWLPPAALAQWYWVGECLEAYFNNRFFRTFFRYIRRTAADPCAFFEELAAACRRKGFFELSPTQELMTRILAELAAGRADEELWLDLLRFDWLRSGHRYLPDFLATSPLAEVKDRLWLELPQDRPPLFTPRTRGEFFKRVVFARFSAGLLREAGLSGGTSPGDVCFLRERSRGVLNHCEALLVPPAG